MNVFKKSTNASVFCRPEKYSAKPHKEQIHGALHSRALISITSLSKIFQPDFFPFLLWYGVPAHSEYCAMQPGKHAATWRVIRSNVFYSDGRFHCAGVHQFFRRIDACKRKKACHFSANIGQICQIMTNFCIHFMFLSCLYHTAFGGCHHVNPAILPVIQVA